MDPASPTRFRRERDPMNAELLLAIEEASVEASVEAGINFSADLFSNALFWNGDSDAFMDYRLKDLVASTRRRTRTGSLTLDALQQPTLTDLSSVCLVPRDHTSIVASEGCLSSTAAEHDSEEMCLKERLKMSIEMDINSPSFTWENLVSLHPTEHVASSGSEDSISKPVEVTVNSGGVVFFATFEQSLDSGICGKEAVAVLKFISSSLLTQSERLGNELAKHMGVFCPQSRIIYKGSDEWIELRKAAERCSNAADSVRDEDDRATYTEFLEVLSLSRCVLLMGYIKGYPFFESTKAFQKLGTILNTATTMSRVLLLDLVLRNEDRLCCKELGWRGNSANLLCAQEIPLGCHLSTNENKRIAYDNRDFVSLAEKRFPSADNVLSLQGSNSLLEIPNIIYEQIEDATNSEDDPVFLVAIDSGVPRRPPAGKRAMDKVSYPKLVELALNCPSYAASLLYEVSGGKLGLASVEIMQDEADHMKAVKAFQIGLREGIKDMHNLHIFLVKLYRMLQIMLLKFFQSINTMFPSEDKPILSDFEADISPSPKSRKPNQTVLHKEDLNGQKETIEGELSNLKIEDSLGQRSKECGIEDPCFIENPLKRTLDESPIQGSPRLSKQLTRTLKSVNRTAKVNPELNEELQKWNEILDIEGRRFCEEYGFITGFLEGGTNHSIIRIYELKVRLEHILERMSLISQAADTEGPSKISECLFIGGAMAAESVYTLQHIGITHVLCLCPSELKSFGEELSKIICYKEIEILDQESTDISCKFQEACEFINDCERLTGKCLVHCFEGRSRSATIVLAYLMTHKNLTLSDAWKQLKAVHARSQPNDGFMQALINLDLKLHGSSSMGWQKKRPTLQICHVCGKNIGLSRVALNSHMQRSHPGASTIIQ